MDATSRTALEPAESPRRAEHAWSVLLAVAVLAALAALGLSTRWASTPVAPPIELRLGEVAYRLPPQAWRAALERTLGELPAAEQAALQRLSADIDRQVAEAFALPRAQVTQAADWYYSAEGQVFRLLVAGMEYVSADRGVGERLAERLGRELFPAEAWTLAQTVLLDELTRSALAEGSQVMATARQRLQAELAPWRLEAPGATPAFAVPEFGFDDSLLLERLRTDPAVGWQAVVIPTAMVAGLTARGAARAAAARGVGRGAGGVGSMACIGTGPLLGVCMVTVFTGTLVAGEYALLRIDEALNRPMLERALHAEIDRLEEAVTVELQRALVDGLAAALGERRRSIEAELRPIDQILGLPR